MIRGRDRSDDNEVTEEMMKAGALELLSFTYGEDSPKEAARSVFLAMLSKRHSTTFELDPEAP
jgi:hypothetical protein